MIELSPEEFWRLQALRKQPVQDPDDHRPRTLSMAVQYLVDTMPEQRLRELAGLSEHDLYKTHFGLALDLRNGLLHKNYALQDDTGERHLDDASAAIVKALWLHLRHPRQKIDLLRPCVGS